MKQKWLRVLTIVLGILLVIVILAFSAIQVFLRLPLPSYTGTLTLDGLKDKVEIRTDGHGVPHIFAQNEHDLFFAQGYITARERMFQMDLTRLAGRGELSTYLGDTMINTDKFLKTVGFYRTAEEEYRLLPAESKAIMVAYTQGVNAYISNCSNLPIEYTVLGVKPPSWKEQDSMVAGLLMAYSLNRSKDTELVLYKIGQQAGQDVLKYIIPSLPGYAPTVSGPKVVASSKIDCQFPSFATQNGPAHDTQLTSVISMDIPASNWMIFSGSRTTSGKAVFTGSPDLQPKIPALFYLVHLKGAGYDVIGGSIPGAPGINVLGFNRKIAWSTTNGRGDELDYFIEKVNPDNSGQYLTESGYQDFKIVEETLKIKAKDTIREEKFKVRISRHGPIISEVMADAPANCAMNWVGLQPPTHMFEGLIALMKAGNFQEFRKALSVVRTPTLNFGYADVEGNIGYQYVMSVPLRKTGSGTLPVPGDSGDYEWKGFVPFEDLPYDINPPQGYVASFNNLPKEVPYHITDYFMFERALRCEEMAKAKQKFTPDEIRNMQLDTISMVAKRWTPLVINACSGMPEMEADLDILDRWNRSIDASSPGATLFNSFYTHFIRNTLEDNLGKELCATLLTPYLLYQPDMTLANIIGDNSHYLYDDLRTPSVKETRDDVIRKSMQDAVAELSSRLGPDPGKWEWGKVHTMTFKHPMGSKLPLFNLSPIPTSGDGFTINAGLWDSQNPYAMDSGGVIRMVVDMSDLESATLTSPPGQSGQYISPYYGDMADSWARGQQIPAHFLSANKLSQLLILNPRPGN